MVHYICGNIKDIQAQYNIGAYVDIIDYINKPVSLFDTDNNDIVVDGEKTKKDYVTLKKDKRFHAIIVNIRRH